MDPNRANAHNGMVRIQLQKDELMTGRREKMFYLLLMVDLRLVVHLKLKLISTMFIANFTDAIINYLKVTFFIYCGCP